MNHPHSPAEVYMLMVSILAFVVVLALGLLAIASPNAKCGGDCPLNPRSRDRDPTLF